jgi:5'-deoxy-5'-methylthioadenosine phosphorylase
MLAILGGSGLDRMPGLERLETFRVLTPFGEPSAPLLLGKLGGRTLVFLPRHGDGHSIPPHKINYRANIWALKEQGVTAVVAVASVGGITPEFGPGTIAIPDQLLDYTYDREQTFFDGHFRAVEHIDFTEPYCDSLRQSLCKAAALAKVQLVAHGCYAVTQGPRLETRAEIIRMGRDGADMVGMTAMPEAALAREAGLCYAHCALVVNWAAGLASGPISVEAMAQASKENMARLISIVQHLQL